MPCSCSKCLIKQIKIRIYVSHLFVSLTGKGVGWSAVFTFETFNRVNKNKNLGFTLIC